MAEMLGFPIIVLTLIISGKAHGEVVLSPSSPAATESNSLTLTCTYIGNDTVTSFTWRTATRNETMFNNIGIITKYCNPMVFPVDNLYEYACPSKKQYTWTIKKVYRENDGERYQCVVDTLSSGVISSNDVSISVNVPITYVEMVTPRFSIVTVRENEQVTFQCKTFPGLPKASVTWFKRSPAENEFVINTNIYTTKHNVNGLIEVSSTLTYLTSRNDNKWRIYCKASNVVGQTPLASTNKPWLNIQYPSEPPIISGFADGGEYTVIEGRPGYLSCLVKGGNPMPTLSWDCYNSGDRGFINGLSTLTVTKGQGWLAKRGNDKPCTCISSQNLETKSVSVNIVTLYSPTVPTFEINGTTVSGTVNIIRNHSLSITCISSGNPPPLYTWTIINMNHSARTGQVLTIPNVQTDMKILCKAQNTMIPTGGASETSSASSYINVKVLSK